MKNRILKSRLSKAGFVRLPRRGKGSHTVWRHPFYSIAIIQSGKDKFSLVKTIVMPNPIKSKLLNFFSRKLNNLSFLFSSLINMYLVEVPNVDPSKTWHTVAEFKTRSQAIAFCDDHLCCTNGWYPMLTTNGSYWSCDTPNPQLKSRNNQFLTIEEFELECDCLDFIRANFPDANADGNIYLISQTN